MRYRAEAIRLIHKKGERSEPPIFGVLSSAFLKFSIFFCRKFEANLQSSPKKECYEKTEELDSYSRIRTSDFMRVHSIHLIVQNIFTKYP